MDNNIYANINTSERWLITFTIMIVTVAEVLDMTIVNVAMPHMMGNLEATSEQISWVLTSYVVSAAIFMPITGFISAAIGQKRLLLSNILGFCISSILCGLAVNLGQIVFFRVLQGIFGAALVPLSQTILRSIFPKEEHGKAMAIWGIGIMAGPILGPTLGGYITDSMSWRWVFYINVPVCIVSYLMALALVKETPRSKVNLDKFSLVLLVVGIGSLQIFLDRGNQENWFESFSMICLFLFAITTITIFIFRSLTMNNPIINLRLFKDRNFSVACFLIIIFGLNLFGTLAIIPVLLQNLLDYPAKIAGQLMAPQGIASAIAMFIISRVHNKIDNRYLVAFGIFLTASGSFLRSYYSLDISFINFIIPSLIQGFGTGMFFVPLSTIAFKNLSYTNTAEAAGLFSFSRNLGSSIGISIAATMISNKRSSNWQILGENLVPFNKNLQSWLYIQNLDMDSSNAATQLATILETQATMLAYIETFYLIALTTITLLPLLLLLQIKDKKNI